MLKKIESEATGAEQRYIYRYIARVAIPKSNEANAGAQGKHSLRRPWQKGEKGLSGKHRRLRQIQEPEANTGT